MGGHHLPKSSERDLALSATVAQSRIHEFAFGDPTTELSNRLGATVLLPHPRELKSRSLIRGLVQKLTF